MKKILIVDDSNLSRRILGRILVGAGYEIIEATDGFSALEQYSLENPDLVVLDLTMEGMHGLDVLEKLRQMNPQVRIVVASADIQTSTHELVRAAGAAAFINKPFDEKVVLDTVKDVMEES